MEEAEYKDNEIVLYKTKAKLSLPHKEPQEVECFVTQGHVVIETEEPIKIPLSLIQDIAVYAFPSANYSVQAQEPSCGTATLIFLDDQNKKRKLSLETAAGTLSYLKEVVKGAKEKQQIEQLMKDRLIGELSSMNLRRTGLSYSYGYGIYITTERIVGVHGPSWLKYMTCSILELKEPSINDTKSIAKLVQNMDFEVRKEHLKEVRFKRTRGLLKWIQNQYGVLTIKTDNETYRIEVLRKGADEVQALKKLFIAFARDKFVDEDIRLE